MKYNDLLCGLKVCVCLFVCVCVKMFVEIWLHHYSLEMYQKLQSPQVKVRKIFPHLPPPLPCNAASHGWLLTGWPQPHPPHTSTISVPSRSKPRVGKWCWPAAVWLVILSMSLLSTWPATVIGSYSKTVLCNCVWSLKMNQLLCLVNTKTPWAG